MAHDRPGDRITRREALRRTALLLGGAVSAPTLAGVLAGCGRDAGQGPYRPQVLTDRQHSLVATIADHIIPETDTPGARDVQVDRFIDEMLANYYLEEERELFLTGLDGVDDRAVEAHGSPFLDCTSEQQLAILVELDEEAFAPRPSPPDEPPADPAVDVRARSETTGDPVPPELEADTVQWIHGDARTPRRADLPFFRTMKELTIVGYYTSEAGATVELIHEAIPGRQEGCIPYERVGRTWAV